MAICQLLNLYDKIENVLQCFQLEVGVSKISSSFFAAIILIIIGIIQNDRDAIFYFWQTSFVTYWHRYSKTMDECLLFRFYSSVFFRFRSALHSKQLLQWHIDQVLQTFYIFCIFYSIYIYSINTRGSTCFKNRLENSFQVKILTSTRLNSKFFCTSIFINLPLE